MGATRRWPRSKGAVREREDDDDARNGVRLREAGTDSPVGLVETFHSAAMTVRYVRLNTSRTCEFSWSGDVHYVALHDLNTKDAETFVDDQTVDRRRDLRGRLTFIPAGCRAWGWCIPRTESQFFTALFIDPRALEPALASRLELLPQRPRLYFMDGPLRSTLAKLGDALSAGTPPDRLYIESLCLTGLLELCRAQEIVGGETQKRVFGRNVMRQIAEYMDAHLDADVSLEDLSAIAGLSRFHFLRAFKRETRETPYQHLLRRRIERAQDLLKSDDMTVAEIASAVGFKSPTRFAAAFRRLSSDTPSAYRAASRRS